MITLPRKFLIFPLFLVKVLALAHAEALSLRYGVTLAPQTWPTPRSAIRC
jgi:hypothetical protein